MKELPAINLNLLQFKKTYILSLFIALAPYTFGQTKGDTIRVLELKEKNNYKEINKFWSKADFTALQEVAYNEPTMIDEEFTQVLLINFLQEPKMLDKRLIDIESDTASIQCSFRRLSVWNWSGTRNSIAGKIRIVSITRRTIELEFDLIVTEPSRNIYIYKGKRKFKKSKPLEKNDYRLTAGNTRIYASVAEC